MPEFVGIPHILMINLVHSRYAVVPGRGDTVAALYFAVVAWCVRPDELMAYAEFLGSGFKERGDISF